MSDIHFKLHLALAVCLLNLAACATDSSTSSSMNQRESLWAQRRGTQAAAPAADQYKQELAAVDTGATSPVDMGYQPGQVESSLPADPMLTPDPVPAAAVTEPEVASAEPAVASDIRNMPADYYTVQVMASDNVDRIYKFAAKHKLSVRYVVPTVRDGVTWHVLLLDVYPTIVEAKAALADVSPALNTKPWIRKLGSVQSIMPAE
jgi:septal ring-binding cell division protein DamX